MWLKPIVLAAATGFHCVQVHAQDGNNTAPVSKLSRFHSHIYRAIINGIHLLISTSSLILPIQMLLLQILEQLQARSPLKLRLTSIPLPGFVALVAGQRLMPKRKPSSAS